MSDDTNTSKYDNDSRIPCKYGESCYQKNEAHHKKFKHPPKNSLNKVNEKTNKKRVNTSDDSTFSTNKNCKGNTLQNTLTNWLKLPTSKKPKLETDVQPDTSDESKSECVSASGGDKRQQVPVNEDEEKEKSNDKNIEPDEISDTEITSSDVSSTSLIPIKMDAKTRCKAFFLVDMPDDFYKFWEFCESIGSLILAKGNPTDAFRSVGLKLVGPFEILDNKFSENTIYNQSALLRHYRFYYDPPEFQTVIIKTDDTSEYHLGYFRDDPKENPVFVASNCAAENGIIKSVAENLFGAVNVYLEDYKKTADPFTKLKVNRLQNSLTTWAKNQNITLSVSTAAMKRRETKVVTRTFHKAGLVVPVDKKSEVGYRELVESDATIKKILTNLVQSKNEDERKEHFSKLYPIITFANIANDECDFGTTLELGLDLFTFGSPLLHETIKRLMVTSYQLLHREEFAKIIEAHLEDRRKGRDLSILTKK